jgi:outer membrane protein
MNLCLKLGAGTRMQRITRQGIVLVLLGFAQVACAYKAPLPQGAIGAIKGDAGKPRVERPGQKTGPGSGQLAKKNFKTYVDSIDTKVDQDQPGVYPGGMPTDLSADSVRRSDKMGFQEQLRANMPPFLSKYKSVIDQDYTQPNGLKLEGKIATLPQAIKAGAGNNADLKMAANEVDRAAEEVAIARSRHLPSVNLQSRVGSNYAKSIESSRQYPSYDRSRVSGTSQSQSANIEGVLSQSLWQGGGIQAGVQKAQAAYLAALEKFHQKRQEVMLSIIQGYLKLWISKLKLSLYRQKEAYAQFCYQAALAAREAEKASDYFTAGAQLASATIASQEALAETFSAEKSLQNLIGVEIAEVIYLPGNMPVPFKSASALVAVALKNAPNLRAAQYAEQASRHDISVARSQYQPKLDLEARTGPSWSKSKQHSSAIPSSDPSSLSRSRSPIQGSVGLTLSMNLFSGGAVNAGVRSAELAARSAKVSIYQQRLILTGQCESLFKIWNIRQQNLVTARWAAESANMALQASFQEYVVGLTSILDMTLLQNDWANYSLAYLQSMSDMLLSSYEILACAGMLNEKTLGLKPQKNDRLAYYEKTALSVLAGTSLPAQEELPAIPGVDKAAQVRVQPVAAKRPKPALGQAASAQAGFIKPGSTKPGSIKPRSAQSTSPSPSSGARGRPALKILPAKAAKLLNNPKATAVSKAL